MYRMCYGRRPPPAPARPPAFLKRLKARGNGPLITRTMRRPRGHLHPSASVVIGGTQTHLVIKVLRRDRLAEKRRRLNWMVLRRWSSFPPNLLFNCIGG